MSGSTISFNEIPSNWQVPGNYTEIRAVAQSGALLPAPSRILIIGPANTSFGLGRNIVSGAQAAANWGTGSLVSLMVADALAANGSSPIDVLGIDMTGGVQATGSIVVSAVPGKAGNSAIVIDNRRIPFSVSATDTPTSVATKIAGAIAATSGLPLIALPNAASVSLLAGCAGAWGNTIPVLASTLSQDNLPGLTLTITPFATGADPAGTDPVAAMDVVSSTWYTDIINAWSSPADLTEQDVEYSRRYGAMVKLDARGWAAVSASYGQALTNSALGNSKFITVLPLYNSPSTPARVAAVYGAVGALALANDPARQLRSLVLPGVGAPAETDCFTEDMRQQLLLNGCATFTRSATGQIVIERAVTQYRQTDAGIADTAWRDIMTAAVNTRVRYDWDNYIALLYPRAKRSIDGSIASQFSDVVVTPSILKASWAARSLVYEQQGWIENTAALAKNAVFTIDPTNSNRVNAQLPVQIIGNLMDLMTVQQFSL